MLIFLINILLESTLRRWYHHNIITRPKKTARTFRRFFLVVQEPKFRKHFTEKIENVFYFGLERNVAQELDWHNILKDISVTCAEGIPSEHFFANILDNSLVVIDDQYEEAIGAFKVDRRHQNFYSIIF